MNKQILILALSAFFVQQVSSQQTSGHEKGDRVIVKKRIIETVNGKETVTETQDTLDLAEFKEMHLHGRDLLKNENEKDSAILILDGDKTLHIFKDGEREVGLEQRNKNSKGNECKAPSMQQAPNKAVLGVMLQNVEGDNGAQITDIFEGSAAQKAKLQEGDILLSINGKESPTVDKVIALLSDKKPADKVKIQYLRGTKIQTVQVSLQERKEEQSMRTSPEMGSCAPKSCTGAHPMKKCEMYIIKDGDSPEGKEIMKMRGKNQEGTKEKVIIIKKGEGSEGKDESMRKEIEIIRDGDVSILEKDGQEKLASEERSLNVEYLSSSPNPNNGQMKISFQGKAAPTRISVLDMNGKELFTEKIEDFDGIYNKEIQIENAKGTLILKIDQDGKILTQKIIVK